MSELIPRREFGSEGISPLQVSRKENIDSQNIKMQVTIMTTTAGHTIPINLTFTAPIAGTIKMK